MKRLISFLILISICSFGETCFAYDITAAVHDSAKYLYMNVPEPQISSIGGEWSVIALWEAESDIPQSYFDNYYKTASDTIQSAGGILHERKYTEYSRVITALNAIGKNPSDVGGYNLVTHLTDYDKTIKQGVNGAVWALIALDSGSYEDTEDVRNMYVDYILSKQASCGGWSLSAASDNPDTDITAMTLQALAKYKNDERVNSAINNALEYLSAAQLNDGGYINGESENSESTAQVILALLKLGIPLDDSRFVKGAGLVDNMFEYYVEGGGFKHTKTETKPDLMATEQCLRSAAAIKKCGLIVGAEIENKTALAAARLFPILLYTMEGCSPI